MQRIHLNLSARIVWADEHATLGDLAVAAPHAPAIHHHCAGPIENNTLGEGVVVLQEKQDALVEKLLPQREAKVLLCAAEQNRALLDERRLVRVAATG